jgi:hypothetical protein
MDLLQELELFPDFFVEADKDGKWWIVGIDFAGGIVGRKFPIGPYPSRPHAVNAGIQQFWNQEQ